MNSKNKERMIDTRLLTVYNRMVNIDMFSNTLVSAQCAWNSLGRFARRRRPCRAHEWTRFTSDSVIVNNGGPPDGRKPVVDDWWREEQSGNRKLRLSGQVAGECVGVGNTHLHVQTAGAIPSLQYWSEWESLLDLSRPVWSSLGTTVHLVTDAWHSLERFQWATKEHRIS